MRALPAAGQLPWQPARPPAMPVAGCNQTEAGILVMFARTGDTLALTNCPNTWPGNRRQQGHQCEQIWQTALTGHLYRTVSRHRGQLFGTRLLSTKVPTPCHHTRADPCRHKLATAAQHIYSPAKQDVWISGARHVRVCMQVDSATSLAKRCRAL